VCAELLALPQMKRQGLLMRQRMLEQAQQHVSGMCAVWLCGSSRLSGLVTSMVASPVWLLAYGYPSAAEEIPTNGEGVVGSQLSAQQAQEQYLRMMLANQQRVAAAAGAAGGHGHSHGGGHGHSHGGQPCHGH
jgi:hypothetical protein